mmetsp:Transcript_22785/g.45666  ORF Transcript_22785/g.45666 Transcript_22785/m.45666 type:complete len:616 (-) Transcript_22785:184-2031(-)
MSTTEAQDTTKSETTPVGEDSAVKSRKDRPTGSTHFGDADWDEERPDEIGDATWGEVAKACCVHDAKEWGKIFVGACGALFFLYFFLFALELLGNSAKVLGGCRAGGLLSDETNPVAGLVIGELATALIQSSSTTTSIIVSLVGAEAISVNTGIYLVMGANIGTSVTNTIVSMGQMADGAQLERAFAGATVHDIFNLLSVAILFPLEVISHYLYHLTNAMLPDSVGDGEKWEGPIKKIVSPFAGRVLKANKDVIKDIATGKVESCDAYYPVLCLDGIEDYKHCASKCDKDAGEEVGVDCGRVGLITCDKDSGECPGFFQNGASLNDDYISGGVCLVLSLFLLFVCLMALVNVLQRGLAGMSTRIIYKATNVNGLIGIVIGAAITILVQSSSITTSVLTPFVGLGVIQLEQMLPLTLGANIGTTITGLLAAMVSDNVDALQVALCHLFFNISGIVIWYPIPIMRRIPLRGARALGRATRRSRLVPPIYIIVVFFVIPLLLLGLSSLFMQKTVGFTVLGSFLVIGVVLGIARFIWWWKKQEGLQKCLACLDRRTDMNNTMKTLPEDMQFLKSKVSLLAEHTGLPEDEEAGDAQKGSDGTAEEVAPENEEVAIEDKED